MDFDTKKYDEAQKQKQRWEKWEREMVEGKQRALEFRAYWERRKKDDRDLWRNKDFANAIDKMSRAGYKGKHGNFDVPEEKLVELDALYMQATVGDYDGNAKLKCSEEWKRLLGKTRVESQQEFIKLTNRMLTRFGWNPPEGWV